MIWILEQRHIGDTEWFPCLNTAPRMTKTDFDGLLAFESFSSYEFRAVPYVRAVQPPPNPNAPGPVEPPKPPHNRRVSNCRELCPMKREPLEKANR